MLRSRFFVSLLIVLFLSTVALANTTTVSMTYLGNGRNHYGGYYTYPYYFSINGGSPTPLMCDSFSNHAIIGETWTASVTGLLQGKGLFGKDVLNYLRPLPARFGHGARVRGDPVQNAPGRGFADLVDVRGVEEDLDHGLPPRDERPGGLSNLRRG